MPGLDAKRLPYLVERLGVRRALIYAADRDNAVHESDSALTEPRDSDVFSKLVQVFPVADGVDPCAVDIWDLAPQEGEEGAARMLTTGLSSMLASDIHRFDRYIAVLRAIQQAMIIELLAQEVLRLEPDARMAVFYAVQVRQGDVFWDTTPLVIFDSFPFDLSPTEIPTYRDWALVAARHGRVLAVDRDLSIVISRYLQRISGVPGTDDDVLVIDLGARSRITG